MPILILLTTISTILFYTHSYSPQYNFNNSLLCPFLFSSVQFQQFSFMPILILLSTISTILFYAHSYSPQYYFNNSLLCPFLFSSVLFQQFSFMPILILLTTISTILFYTHSYSSQYYFNNSLLCPFLFSSVLFQQFFFIPILILLTTISKILFVCIFIIIATIPIIPPLSICFASPTPLPTHHHMLLELNLEISKKLETPVLINWNTFFIDCFVQHKLANSIIAHEAPLKNSYDVDNNYNNQL